MNFLPVACHLLLVTKRMETPKDKLKRMTAWEAEPALSDEDLDALLAAVALQDDAGAGPSDDDWTRTYDLNGAASHVWLIKAASSSIFTDVVPPGTELVAS